MAVPDPNYRANPYRAIFVRGTIDQSLVDALTPEILKLQYSSRDPITVYIDSRGGNTASADLLSRLLRVPDQDGSPPCWIITVATGRAASAAADVLCNGNYAIVYPETVLHFHGARYSTEDPVTLEAASVMTEMLQSGNDYYAFVMARHCISRFILQFLEVRSEFEQIRAEQKPDEEVLDDLRCFFVAVSRKVSKGTAALLSQALGRYLRYEQLASTVRKAVVEDPLFLNTGRLAETEASIIRAILQFEADTNLDDSWTFKEQGLRQLKDDFLLLTEYLTPQQDQSLERLSRDWKDYFLKDSDRREIEALEERAREAELSKRLKAAMSPIWFFFVALCHSLQEGENEIPASDAVYLGLVDEVIGQDRISLRMLLENAPSK